MENMRKTRHNKWVLVLGRIMLLLSLAYFGLRIICFIRPIFYNPGIVLFIHEDTALFAGKRMDPPLSTVVKMLKPGTQVIVKGIWPVRHEMNLGLNQSFYYVQADKETVGYVAFAHRENYSIKRDCWFRKWSIGEWCYNQSFDSNVPFTRFISCSSVDRIITILGDTEVLRLPTLWAQPENSPLGRISAGSTIHVGRECHDKIGIYYEITTEDNIIGYLEADERVKVLESKDL